jgi:hypothetical protein
MTVCLVLAFLMTWPAHAERLAPRIAAARTSDGASVEVVLSTGEKLKGRLFGVTRDGVTIIPGKKGGSLQPREIAFSDMKSFKRRPAVVRNVLAGFGALVSAMMVAVMIAFGIGN